MTYEKAMAEVVKFENTDVITTSRICDGPHGGIIGCIPFVGGGVIPYSEQE